MKITDVKTEVVHIPLKKPFRIAFAVQDHSVNVLVKIMTDDGLWGIGEAAPFEPVTGENAGTVLEVLKLFRQGLIGRDALDIEGAQPHDGRPDRRQQPPPRPRWTLHCTTCAARRWASRCTRCWAAAKTNSSPDMTVGIDTPEAMAAEAARAGREGRFSAC